MPTKTVVRIEVLVGTLAIAAGLAHRFLFGWLSPFWLDEAYTGVIASQRTWRGLLDWCRHELSGPFFYVGMWAWEKVAGNGNIALRVPSLAASLGAIALIIVWGGSIRRERFLWAAFTAVWLPGLAYATQARPQALLFLLATSQTIAFLRCVQNRSARWLTIWSTISAAMMLTHIYAAAIIGLQFLCLLWTFRDRPRAFWPSLVIFAVVAAWLPLQLSFLFDFLRPGVAWYPMSGPAEVLSLPYHLFGTNIMAFVVLGAAAVVLGMQWAQYRSTGTPLPYSRAEAMVMSSAVISVTLVFAAGFLRPSFTPRYLFPSMPALLFGLTIVLCRTRVLAGLLPSIVLTAWCGATACNAANYTSAEAQQTLNPLEFERASDRLIARHARRVIFVWDNPTSMMSGPKRQSEVGAFFFHRAGYAVDLQAIYITSHRQHAPDLAARADSQNAAILWIGGDTYPEGLLHMAQFDCRHFGGNGSQSMACSRDGSVRPTW